MFDRLKIASKLFAGFGLLLAIIVGIAVLHAYSSLTAQTSMELLAHRKSIVATAQKAQRDLFEARMNIWVALATGDADRWQIVDAALGRAKAETVDLVAATRDPQRRVEAESLVRLIDAYGVASQPIRQIRGQNDHLKDPAAVAAIANAVKIALDINQFSTSYADNFEHLANATEAKANQSSQFDVMLAVAAGVVSFIAGVVLSFVIARSIRNPVVRLTKTMGDLAGGDLDVLVPNTGDPNEIGAMARSVLVFKENAIARIAMEAEAATKAAEADAERERSAAERAAAAAEQAAVVARLGASLRTLAAGDLTTQIGDDISASYAQIRNDFNDAIQRLKSTIEQVVASTATIQAGTEDISGAAEDLSQRTAQQAASLEETASALDQITAIVRKSAENTQHAAMIAAGAEVDARDSADVVAQAVKAMDAIAISGRQIGQIIGVIDEIAFQTNLLALNAGVEAARAGDAGRGFAVVASEVRALAQRSAEASKDIKSLIVTSTNHVDQGVHLVAETGKSLNRIMSRVSEINAIVGEIAEAAKEQATGLEEINRAVNQMDDVTQQNAAMVEELTAASHTLSQESRTLSDIVGQFRTTPATAGLKGSERRLAA